MKKLTAILVLMCIGLMSFAQDNSNSGNDEINTVFGQGGKVRIGWFVGGIGGYTKFCSSDVAVAGISGGIIINHNFTIGLSGQGIANSPGLIYSDFLDGQDVKLEGGWGGLLLEYTLFPKSPVHVTFPVTIGGGTMSYISHEKTYDPEDYEWDYDHDVLATDNFFVVEPGVRAEINVLKFLRFGAGVSYRYTPDLDLPNTSKDFINNFAVSGSLKFGKF